MDTKINITEKELEQKIDADTIYELSEAISNLISDKTGFCHTGFTFEINVLTQLDIED